MFMTDQRFIRCVQEPDVRDGIIFIVKYLRNFVRTLFHTRTVRILLFSHDQRVFVIAFRKVHSASINNAVGMRLYSLNEMSATPPFRRFVFVNHEQDSDRHLEVVAQEISSVELTEEVLTKDGIDAVARYIKQLHLTPR
jgi:hypothetical protein